MKKLFVWLVAMCGMLTLTGCVMDETLDALLPEDFAGELIAKQQWDKATFKTLTGSEDLVVVRDPENEKAISISNPDYDQDYLAVILLKSDCEKSKAMLPHLDKLAARMNKYHFISYVPVLLDVYEDSTGVDVEWINNLSNLEVFMNAATTCSENACQEVFLPKITETLSGSVYFVRKNDITKTKKGFSWDTEADPQEQAKKMESAFVEFLNLREIEFDTPTVKPWN